MGKDFRDGFRSYVRTEVPANNRKGRRVVYVYHGQMYHFAMTAHAFRALKAELFVLSLIWAAVQVGVLCLPVPSNGTNLVTIPAFLALAAAAYVVSCTRAIVEQAELNAAEYDRMTALLKESTRLEQEYHHQLMDFMKQYEQQQRTRLNSLLDAFAYLADDDTNYERAVYAILKYADQTGLALQHRDFDAFRAAMCSEEEFVLR